MSSEVPTGLTGHDQRTAEQLLSVHELVESVRVRPMPDSSGLLAEVVPAPAADSPELRAGYLESWRSIFEDTHEQVAASGGLGSPAALLGWDDSFTAAPIPIEQMDEWVRCTVDRIVGLRPREVLEIGAGTGLLLREVLRRAPIERYTATDFSEPVVELLAQLAEELGGDPAGPRIEVARAEALSAAAAVSGSYDTVLVNSVAQYFPSLRYLEQVIASALAVVRPGGHLLIGDLRNGALQEAFAALKLRRRGEPGGDLSRELGRDGELSVDPAWGRFLLHRFPELTAIEVAPRRGEAVNEMTLFRFDLILHVGCPAEQEAELGTEWLPDAGPSLDELTTRLTTGARPFGYRRLGNARLTDALAARSGSAVAARPSIDPEQVCRVAAEHGWLARPSWRDGDPDGRFDVSLLPGGGTGTHFRFADPITRPVEPYRPAAMFPPKSELALAATLRAAVPSISQVVFVRELDGSAPVSGADRAPVPEASRTPAAEVAPAGSPESVLDLVLAAFARHIGGDSPIEADQSFFAMGGASLPAAMCVRELKGQGVAVTLRDLFECQTALALAERAGSR